MGLRDVAELCRRDYAAPGRDCNAVRDQLLLIAIELNLTRDRLDQQSTRACAPLNFCAEGGAAHGPARRS